MRILVAGATGAIGVPLVKALVARGHEVYGMSRDPARAAALERHGARGLVCDALDAARVRDVVASARPDAIISQLTQLPQTFKPRELRQWYARNDRVRYEGTTNLLQAAQANRVQAFVAQGAAFWYAPTPGPVKTETDPMWEDGPEPFGTAVRNMQRTEEAVLGAKGLRTVVLRYGTFYGPGTWYSRDGQIARMMAKRQYPIAGDGSGVTSFVHVDDAAAATALAVEKDVSGVYNITDDEPAPIRTWQPALAAALGAPPPLSVPLWVARVAMGKALATYVATMRGADNARARAALGWSPKYPSWRLGFHSGL